MTVVAGLVHGGRVWLGADSAGVDEAGRLHRREKITVLPKGALLAYAGDSRLNRSIRVAPPDTFPSPLIGSSRDAWAQTVAHVAATLALDAKPPITDEDGQVNGGGLLAWQGSLWLLDQDCAHPTGDCWAVGSGSDYALGALDTYAGHFPDTPPDIRLRRALNIACARQSDCQPPLEILSA